MARSMRGDFGGNFDGVKKEPSEREKQYVLRMENPKNPIQNGVAFQVFKEEDLEMKIQLGKGGMATTYLCRFRQSRDLVVLKEPSRQDCIDHVENMRNEYGKHLYAGAAHLNIVRPLGKMEYHDQKMLGMVLEYVPEGTLEDVISTTRQKRTEVCLYTVHHIVAWLSDVASALVYMHSNELAHLDLSPSNILMPNGWTKAVISDFGISKLWGRKNPRNERGDPKELGTCPDDFAAPEVKPGYGHDKSDVYSLAVILWRLVYRKPRAFPTNRANLRDRPACPDLIAELEEILKNSWAHEPATRWSSTILYEKLRQFLDVLFPKNRPAPDNRFALLPPRWEPGLFDTTPKGTMRSHESLGESDYYEQTNRQSFLHREVIHLNHLHHRTVAENPYYSDFGRKTPVKTSESAHSTRSNTTWTSSESSDWSGSQSASTTVTGSTITEEYSEYSASTITEESEEVEEWPASETTSESSSDETEGRGQRKRTRNLKLLNLLDKNYYLRAFDILPPMTLENPLVEFTNQDVPSMGPKQQNIVAIGNVRGIYVSLLSGMNEWRNDHKNYMTRIFTPDRKKEVHLHFLKWNSTMKGEYLGALYEYKTQQQYKLVTARVKFRMEDLATRRGGFHFETFQCTIPGGARVFPIDLEWTPTNAQLLAVCFSNAVYIFNEELHKLHPDPHQAPMADLENSQQSRLTIRRGTVASWESGQPPPMICGWDRSGERFTFVHSGTRFTWAVKDNEITRRPLADNAPSFSKYEKLNGQDGKTYLVAETDFGFEVWSFDGYHFVKEYSNVVTLSGQAFPLNFRSMMSPCRDIQFVERSPRKGGFEGGICIAINNPIGRASRLFVWLNGRPANPLELHDDAAEIRCLRFKATPNYLAALTQKHLDIYRIDGEQMKIAYHYDLHEISPYSGQIKWNHDGQKLILHRQHPQRAMIGITVLIRTKMDATTSL